VLLSREISIQRRKAVKALSFIPLFLLVCVTLGALAKAQQGVIDEVNLLSVKTRKDFTELIITSGDDKVDIYVCPKTFQEEMGISFSKGDQVAVTGSKVKQNPSDVIPARELVRGADTLLFRDDKGGPAWDPRSCK